MKPKEQKSHKLLITLIIIFIALLGIGGSLGVWWWQNGEMQKQKTESDTRIAELQKQINDLKKEQTTTTTNSSNNTTTDTTTNWLTYTNKTYGYSIKYPKDWKTACNELGDDINYCIFRGDPIQNKDFTVNIKVFPNVATDWANTASTTPESVLKNITTVTFAGTTAVRADFPGGTEYPAAQYRLVHSGNGYLVSVNYVASRDYSGDPIINSFKFTK